MQIIEIIIEKTANLYSAYAKNVEGIYAGGNTIDEVKQSVVDSIRLLKRHNDIENISKILLGDFEIKYSFESPEQAR